MNKQIKTEDAEKILQKLGVVDYKYLGCGNQGIVFYSGQTVYKVVFSESDFTGNSWYRDFFMNHKFLTDAFYNLKEVIKISDEIDVEKYDYEEGEQLTDYTEEETVEFLVKCWKEKLSVFDCKPENFIRLNGMIKLIDMGATTSYSDNMFLNSCLRMFIFSNLKQNENLKKLQRSAINNFKLRELEGFSDFLTKVFNKIIYKESETAINCVKKNLTSELFYEEYSLTQLPDLEKLFFSKLKENLYMTDIQVSDINFLEERFSAKIFIGYKKIQQCERKISLLIKTCAMDVRTIEQVTKHIVRQLSCPENFYEIVLSIDSKKNDFLRQYTTESNYEKVLQIAEKLIEQKVIDRYVIFNPDEAARINKDWFNLETNQTHSSSNVPVASQLSAFEKCKGDYIFQMDSDVMIGRKDLNHNYLKDMLTELDNNEKVISVGFNIYNSESKPYFGFENGGFVPEVRMGLFHKERFFNQRPLPNSLNQEGKLNLTWYRSMEKHQKETGVCSIRGGDNRTFFVHPQNYRKTEVYTWMNILDRVEQLEIPECQINNFDCEGSFYDWCGPKRKEELIVVAIINNTKPADFLRFWFSLISQDLKDFGIILYDNYSDNGIGILIQQLVKSYKEKITFIKARNKLTDLQCEHIAIRNICTNQQSVIVCADGNNAFIGKNCLSAIFKKYSDNQCDLTCGVSYVNGVLTQDYRGPVDFIHPRKENSNVWKGLVSFRKYLFDSIPLDHFIYDNKELKMSQRKWYESHRDMVKMIPMVEMSSKPLQLDFINYFEEQKSDSEEENGRLLACKKSLSSANIIHNRGKFFTNKNRIDIDITFKCNLNCKGCIRSCGQAPSEERMTVQDIQNFITESIRLGKKWERINVLGGEPTLHPDFVKIVELLQFEYADKFNPKLDIQIVSNGVLPESDRLCKEVEKLKNVRIDYNSYKTNSVIDFFTPFNDAPVDDPDYKSAPYENACWVATDSGFGLNKNGYFACPNCSGIDRVLNLGIGLKSFADLTEEAMENHFKICCKYCGFFKHYGSSLGHFIPRNQRAPFRNVISDSWKEIYDKYNR